MRGDIARSVALEPSQLGCRGLGCWLRCAALRRPRARRPHSRIEEALVTAVGAEVADFLLDTRVERDAQRSGLYHARISDRWNAAFFPFGGMLSALALRAVEREIDEPRFSLRSATTMFSSAVSAGELEIEVAVLRSGRGMSQAQATLRNAGSQDAGHTTLAVYGAARAMPEGFRFTDLESPSVPPPERCESPTPTPATAQISRATFFDQLEVRGAGFRSHWDPDFEPGAADAKRWMRFRRDVRGPDGCLDPLALVAISDTMPPAIWQRIGPDQGMFYAPSCDLTLHIFESTRHEWVLLHARCARIHEGYASATNEIWDPDGRLLCRATQLMYLRFDF
jgi:acyl-CoA thioesterase